MNIIQKILFNCAALTCIVNITNAQNPIQIIPEAGIFIPMSHIDEGYGFSKDVGWQTGLHVDKFWKNFGLGGVVSYQQIGVNPQFPQNDLLNNPTSGYSISSEIDGKDKNLQWKDALVGIGPIVNLPIAKKLGIQMYSKPGVAWVKAPEYKALVNYTNPVTTEYTLFELSPENYTKGSDINFMLSSGIRLQYALTERLGLNLSAQHTFIPGNKFTYSYLDVDLSENVQSNEELLTNFQEAPTLVKESLCAVQNFGVIIGVSFVFGNNNVRRPNLPDKYACSNLNYIAPGYNEVMILDEKQSQKLEWEDDNKKDKTLSYEVVFYEKLETGTYEELATLNTKKNTATVNIKDVVKQKNKPVYWLVNTYANGILQCNRGADKMRLQVFETKSLANQNLPACSE